MIIQPILPLPVLLPLALIVLAVVGWLCIRAARGLGILWGGVCLTLAMLSTAAGVALLLNPGHVEQRPSANAPVWLVGLDVSASMAAPVADEPQVEPRSAVAARVVQQLADVPERDVRWVALDGAARTLTSAQELAAQPAEGEVSAVMSAMAGSIESLRRSGRTVAGAVMITDGRDTQPQALQQLVARAGAASCPVHTVPLGSTWQAPDIVVRAPHPFLHAYPGVQTVLTATVRNTRMGNLQLQVELVGKDETVVLQKTLNLSENEVQSVDFPLTAAAGEYRVRVAPQQGESRTDNNSALITVREVNSRIRVFLAEGAPYWDSKFLAQYLREQSVFDVRSVHRLNEKRFYHINSGDDDAAPAETPDMPMTSEGLRRYDIVVLGKGMEHLLDEEAAQALVSWVREQGGILVLARGRCHAGNLAPLNELSPFEWSDEPATVHRLRPTAEGEVAGLFGRLLPDSGHKVWRELPELEDVCPVKALRPQAQVLAAADGGDTPMLAMMPLGLGAVACLNGEGLWKWDFYPDARSHGNMYREFWRRFLPWVQTAAEFMPGYDLSLHADRSAVQQGEAVRCRLAWRGLGTPGHVSVQVINLSDGQVVGNQTAVPVASASLPRLECAFEPLPPGEYLMRAAAEGTPSPECRLSVRALPTEADNLNADPELPAQVAERTGGQVLPALLSKEQIATIFAMPPGVSAMEDVYCPLWAEWQVLTFMVGCLGIMWFIRRRKGLA